MIIGEGNALYEIDLTCAKEKNIPVPKSKDNVPSSLRYTGTHIKKEEYTGEGVTVAVVDTGIFPHPDFGKRLVGFYDAVDGKKAPWDPNSHGTHVAGIVAGDGTLSEGAIRGAAPKSNLVGVRVLDEDGAGKVRNMLRGVNWILNHGEEYGIRVVNISIGSTVEGVSQGEKLLVRAVEELWNAGFVVCIAAGNEGCKNRGITVPGISKKVITVGAGDDGEMVDEKGRKYLHYSGRGPTGACICKPEIVSFGTNIISTNAMNKPDDKAYILKSGTSMATPIVSGGAALLLEQYPEMTPVQIKWKLMSNAVLLDLPKEQQGAGMLDLKKLRKYIETGD